MSILRRLKDAVQGKAGIRAERSRHWPKVRKQFLAQNPTCVACGGTKKLEVHHIKPFHLFPHLELDPQNLMTLCESRSFGIVCHQFVGHLGSYFHFNPSARADAEHIFLMLSKRKKR